MFWHSFFVSNNVFGVGTLPQAPFSISQKTVLSAGMLPQAHFCVKNRLLVFETLPQASFLVKHTPSAWSEPWFFSLFNRCAQSARPSKRSNETSMPESSISCFSVCFFVIFWWEHVYFLNFSGLGSELGSKSLQRSILDAKNVKKLIHFWVQNQDFLFHFAMIFLAWI